MARAPSAASYGRAYDALRKRIERDFPDGLNKAKAAIRLDQSQMVVTEMIEEQEKEKH